MTAARADDLTAATVPFALFGLYTHLTDFPNLHAPLDIEVPGHADAPITLWVRPEHANDWLTTGFTLDRSTIEPSISGGVRHVAFGVLTGSCLRVRILWTTPVVVDHERCTGDDGTCGRVICFCQPGLGVIGPCVGTVERGCPHLATWLCDEHRLQCDECRQDFRS